LGIFRICKKKKTFGILMMSIREKGVVMKEKLKSKVVLQTVAQLPRHPLVRKAGLFFCQGFKEIRMARSEIFITSYFSKRYLLSKDFMGSLPKNSGQGKKLCGVKNNSVVKGRKGRKVWSGMTPMDVRDPCYT